MFTGIIETIGEITRIESEGSNLHFTIKSSISKTLKIDQSVSHNGVCLTVVKKSATAHVVTAIQETLHITTLGLLKKGDQVNLERAMVSGARLDGHMVQGHVDQTATVEKIVPKDGSWDVHVVFDKTPTFTLIDKGSVCIDGTSLTVVKSKGKKFHVSIIPYTFEHTIFSSYTAGTKVNIEFDVIGKYVERLLVQYQKK